MGFMDDKHVRNWPFNKEEEDRVQRDV